MRALGLLYSDEEVNISATNQVKAEIYKLIPMPPKENKKRGYQQGFNKKLVLRVSEEGFENLRQVADDRGVSISELIRDRLPELESA